jgi:hypothetical protein
MYALYGCTYSANFQGQAFTDQFLSTDPACEGKTNGGLYGYTWSTPPQGAASRLLYRCYEGNTNGSEHFETVDPNCEGLHKDGPLGYILY